jgi:hypothetical protein
MIPGLAVLRTDCQGSRAETGDRLRGYCSDPGEGEWGFRSGGSCAELRSGWILGIFLKVELIGVAGGLYVSCEILQG